MKNWNRLPRSWKRWRPDLPGLMGKIFGQKVPLQIIYNAIKKDRLPQVLFFHGEDGSGKFESALNVAKTIHCESSEDGFCDRCRACVRITLFTHPALTVLSTDDRLPNLRFYQRVLAEKASSQPARIRYYLAGELGNILNRHKEGFLEVIEHEKKSFSEGMKVKASDLEEAVSWAYEFLERFKQGSDPDAVEWDAVDLRFRMLQNSLDRSAITKKAVSRIQEKLSYAQSDTRIVILQNIHRIHAQTSAALLKTLEEPPPDTIFILLAPHLSLLPGEVIAPISSRSFMLRFAPLSPALRERIAVEKFKLSEPGLFIEWESPSLLIPADLVEIISRGGYNLGAVAGRIEKEKIPLSGILKSLSYRIDPKDPSGRKKLVRLGVLSGRVGLSGVSERNLILRLLLDFKA